MITQVLAIGDLFISADHYRSALRQLPINFVSVNLSGTKDQQHAAQQVMEVSGPNSVDPDNSVIAAAAAAEIITGHFAPMGSKLIDAAPGLKLMAVARAGLENVDVEHATKRGIGVVPAFGRNANAVAELQIGLMLSEARNISRADASIKSGGWRKEFPGDRIEIGGSTVGMVGLGHVGRAYAKKLRGFDVRILVFDPFVSDADLTEYAAERASSLDQVFIESDFVTIQARLTSETERFITKHHFDLMKQSAYFINVSRSRLVNTKDMVAALQTGRISGAGIDVFDNEPLGENDPLRRLDNTTLTTHFGGDTEGTNQYSVKLCAEAIETFLQSGKVPWATNAKELGWV